MNNIKRVKEIQNKKIFYFKEHHYSLVPWAKEKVNIGEEDLILFSFDHHTDILDPFLHYSNANESIQEKLLGKIDYTNEKTIIEAIKNLRNDEHIRTALVTGIISKAFIISRSNTFDFPQSIEEEERLKKWQQGDLKLIKDSINGKNIITPREKRTYREADIYMPPFFKENVYDNEEYYNMILDDSFLSDKFEVLSRMCPSIIKSNGEILKKYILDIDLDYFHKVKNLEIKSMDIFAKLVRNAEIITIAQEPICVEIVREEQNLTSSIIMDRLLKLLTSILNA